MKITQQPTVNILPPLDENPRAAGRWMPDVGCWSFAFIFLCTSFLLRAQTPVQLPPDAQAQLLLQQQPVDVSQTENISAAAAFDPPVVRAGEKAFYRVTVNATQNSIAWPDKIATPPELKFGPDARGQTTRLEDNKYRPLTAFLCEVTATAPGHFVVSNFAVTVGGARVEIPAAHLEVVESNAALLPTARRLALELSETNLFLGQPFRVRVLLPVGPNHQAEALNQIQFIGDGFMTDKTAARCSIQAVSQNGQSRPAFIYETVSTPVASGPLMLSAQGFTASPFAVGPISIRPGGGPISFSSSMQGPVFLVSDAMRLNVRPVPMESAPPGFTGAIGKFTTDRPQLATNRVRIGNPVHLKLGFHGESNLTRFVPPQAPRSREWQIIADNPPGGGFTFIPLTDETTNTPAIPFYAFDPATKRFYDLTIPALPLTVIGEELPVQLPPLAEHDQSSGPKRLSGPAATPGKTTANLKPLQLQGWFVAVQILPVIGLIALWRRDERRRFLEAHPEIVRRRKAKRELRKERKQLQQAIAANDARAFVRHAAAAMRIAVAPHFPAEALALVGGDVLSQLHDAGQNKQAAETIQKIFEAADAQFAAAPASRTDVLDLQTKVETVLKMLEEKL
jgi:hypothetical protein